jgi:hypothetical protein
MKNEWNGMNEKNKSIDEIKCDEWSIECNQSSGTDKDHEDIDIPLTTLKILTVYSFQIEKFQVFFYSWMKNIRTFF